MLSVAGLQNKPVNERRENKGITGGCSPVCGWISGGRASQWAPAVDANVNTEQWGSAHCLTSGWENIVTPEFTCNLGRNGGP